MSLNSELRSIYAHHKSYLEALNTKY